MTRRLVLTLFGVAMASANGQQPTGSGTQARVTDEPRQARAFLRCLAGACALTVPTEDVPFVQWVRDVRDADVSVLVTQQQTGAGGLAVTILAADVERRDGRVDTLRFSILPSAADSITRVETARWIRIALLRAAASKSGAGLDVSYSPQLASHVESATRDPWRNWTISAAGQALLDDQEESSVRVLGAGIAANRVTAAWRIGIGGGFASTGSRTTLSDSSVFRAKTGSSNVAAFFVRSLGARWAAGIIANTTHSDFLNEERVVRVAPALEFDVFPYSVATHRSLTIGYQAGVSTYRFEDTTLFGRLRQTRFNHNIAATFVRQAVWGSVDSDLGWTSFLDDPRFYRVDFDATASLTLAKGFALTINGTASRVRDQIYLARAGLTDNQILAQQKALATSFHSTLAMGLTYTFGSIFSSVVNPRFAGWGVPIAGRVQTTGF